MGHFQPHHRERLKEGRPFSAEGGGLRRRFIPGAGGVLVAERQGRLRSALWAYRVNDIRQGRVRGGVRRAPRGLRKTHPEQVLSRPLARRGAVNFRYLPLPCFRSTTCAQLRKESKLKPPRCKAERGGYILEISAFIGYFGPPAGRRSANGARQNKNENDYDEARPLCVRRERSRRGHHVNMFACH